MSTDAVTTVSVEIAGKEISFETGKLAKQASGAVVVRQGDTMVLCTATAGNLRDVDFLPLTVDVEERMYAAGKIPGSFFKREGRAGEKGTLTARMIDRPIRPLFPKGWRYETQLVAIPLSHRPRQPLRHPRDERRLRRADALRRSRCPTPVGAVRIGKIDGNFVVNPDEADLVEDTDLDLIVAGTDEAILMVEAGANEIPEAEILDALDIAHDEIKKLCAAQRELAEKAGKEKLVSRAARRSTRTSSTRSARATAPRSTRPPRSRTSSSARTRPRPSRRPCSSSTPATPTPTTYAEYRQQRAARVRQAREDDHPRAHRRPQEAPRRPRASARSATISIEVGVAAAHARLGALHPRPDAGAQRRRAGHAEGGDAPRHARARDRTSATCTTTTSRRSRSGRPASCAAPSAATSATARSPSGRWCR